MAEVEVTAAVVEQAAVAAAPADDEGAEATSRTKLHKRCMVDVQYAMSAMRGAMSVCAIDSTASHVDGLADNAASPVATEPQRPVHVTEQKDSTISMKVCGECSSLFDVME